MTGTTAATAAGAYRAYLEAVLDADRHRAFEVIDRARAEGLDLGSIYLEVFQPTLREIGRLWQENVITVADEHLATAITQTAMARLYGQTFVWDQGTGRTLVAACADLERHEVGLRMLCDLLELEGWDTVYLGASVPVEALVAMVERRRPGALALSASITPHLPRLRTMIQAVREAMGQNSPLILVGGRPFLDDPSLALRLGADLTAKDAREAVRLLEQQVRSS